MTNQKNRIRKEQFINCFSTVLLPRTWYNELGQEERDMMDSKRNICTAVLIVVAIIVFTWLLYCLEHALPADLEGILSDSAFA